MNFSLIYITNSTEKEAKSIAIYLLEKRLVACINIFPIKSLYRWKGKVISKKEFVLIAKAPGRNFDKIKREVKKIHSYSIPCVIKISADANKEYLSWIIKETSK